MSKPSTIVLEGGRQNNLRDINVEIPLNQLTVVTGVSGSGKSSLAFDTIYAEGQRRYVETFSPYARQFLDRMDKPHADRIDGIPPAIAIDQTNPVRTSRSTVGTMTELNDHLKLLFARAAQLYCTQCTEPVRRDSAEDICDAILGAEDLDDDPAPYLVVTFPIAIPDNFTEDEVRDTLERQGYPRIWARSETTLQVIQDRLSRTAKQRTRLIEAIETSFRHGNGRVTLHPLNANREPLAPRRYSHHLHCADCDIDYRTPTPNLFSFNSPVGACPDCRGFGRTIGIDYNLVIPDTRKTLAEGAIKPWQSPSYSECQDALMDCAAHNGIPTDVPWSELSPKHQQWVLEGEGDWDDGYWFGVRRFFDWLEGRSYRMHIRVLLSRYRAYHPCQTCGGARLKPDALAWRLPEDTTNSQMPTIHDVMLMPISTSQQYFQSLTLPAPLDEATDLLLQEIHSRLMYLVEVGLGYLTLDRQSRTLSGGEVQRINLTTALGTSLVNTLFVLDEPSIGLHPRDIQRLVRVLHRLRDAGNTLLVVEHDADVIGAADRIIDIGPGPGEHGGNVVFSGSLDAMLTCPDSLTAQYLRGDRTIPPPDSGNVTSTLPSQTLRVIGAAHHNLKTIDVEFPLGALVCITGVSGSGKSTLMQEIVYYGLSHLLQQPKETPGTHTAIIGYESITDVVLVDQTVIGRTTRSNPASYVGAFAAIRKAFSKLPIAIDRGYTAGTFSFNSGDGRCPDCSGNGFEHVEMQFLSDVYLRCATCDGRRYRDEILDVRLQTDNHPYGLTIADVLDLTVNDAIRTFAGYREIYRNLQPLATVGLGYLRLGQPVPTLSGGEAQRLKLAGHLAKAGKKRSDSNHTLFLFDEPTTGLHFDDVNTLTAALRQLIERGHSVLVIEHNLDLIAAADWLIDLGPEGGDAGGELVCSGSPTTVAENPRSHTGTALRARREHRPSDVAETGSTYDVIPHSVIAVHQAREHNLQGIDLSIPRDALTVITGVSGSGKSTVAFDILFAEGQRRYLESLNAYARQFVQPASRPDIDSVTGIPPTVAIEQRTSRGGRKSTVATVTEIYHFLRLLFVKLGTQFCPECDSAIEPQSAATIRNQIMRRYKRQTVAVFAPLIQARKGVYTELAKWAAKNGFDKLRVDDEMLPTANWPRLDRYREHTIELPIGNCRIIAENEQQFADILNTALEYGNGNLTIRPTSSNAADCVPTHYSTLRACPTCNRSFAELDPRMFSYNSHHGWCPDCTGSGMAGVSIDDDDNGHSRSAPSKGFIARAQSPCPSCNGLRLCPDSLAVRFRDRAITDFTTLSVQAAATVLTELSLSGREAAIAADIQVELISRLRFLEKVGLSYLALDRAAPTLSGGEAQRIRLAAQLGSNLRGVCYILDEPTIGLHARDNEKLLDTLRTLQQQGNTVVVVEHDEQMIRRADHVIDLGPGAGCHGGRVVAAGTVAQLEKSPASTTGRYLRHPLPHSSATRRPPPRPRAKDAWLELKGVTRNNLKNVNARFPLQRLICVSGVSGSGKSTLVRDVLQHALRTALNHDDDAQSQRSHYRSLSNANMLTRILEVDQTPIGKTPRSCPATYVGIWDPIRRLLATTPEAKIRGYKPGRFSFNVAEGRCPECEGQGMKKVEMNFLPDVVVHCESCHGARFTEETLSVRYKGKNVADILQMNVAEAAEFFTTQRSIHHALRLLQDVGLGYLTLGQQSPTLSGGEAQRIKLVTELAKAHVTDGNTAMSTRKKHDHTVYILDEPTIGLHMADVAHLVDVLHKLVDAGHTVIVIEHNLDVIADADWVIDMGPECGDLGGQIVAAGPPDRIASTDDSHTGRFLKATLQQAADT